MPSGRRCLQRCARCSTTLSPVRPPEGLMKVARCRRRAAFVALAAPLAAAFVLAGCVSSTGIQSRGRRRWPPPRSASAPVRRSADVGATGGPAFAAPDLDALVQFRPRRQPGPGESRATRVEQPALRPTRRRPIQPGSTARFRPHAPATPRTVVPPPDRPAASATPARSTLAAAGRSASSARTTAAGRGDRQPARPRTTPRRRGCCSRAGSPRPTSAARLFEQRDVSPSALAQRA